MADQNHESCSFFDASTPLIQEDHFIEVPAAATPPHAQEPMANTAPAISSPTLFFGCTTLFYLLAIVSFGIWIAFIIEDDPKLFRGDLTGDNWIDVSYFVAITITTLGYGDITLGENSNSTKIWLSAFIIFSVTICAALFGMVHHVLGLIEGKIARRYRTWCFIRDDKIKCWYKYALSLIIIAMFFTFGTLIHYYYYENEDAKKRNLAESIYFSAATVTTVGYGDAKLTTKKGRRLGIPFIVTSAAFVGKAIAFIAEGSIRLWRRNRVNGILNETFNRDGFEEEVGVEGVIGFRAYQLYMMERIIGMEAARDLASIHRRFDEITDKDNA